MAVKSRYMLIPVLSAVLLICAKGYFVAHGSSDGEVSGREAIFLLVPDAVTQADPVVRLWVDAASEEGFHLELLHDSDLLKPTSAVRGAGLIVPDEIHRYANDAVIGALYRYVENGGRVMVVYDAGTWDLQGRFPGGGSRLGDLVGVQYANYDKYGKDLIQWSPIWGSAAAIKNLAVPPGQVMQHAVHHTVQQGTSSEPGSGEALVFTRYLYGDVTYPSFRTSTSYEGKVLLESKSGLVSGYREVGTGGVLFVNLPVTYLENRTDGLLLHAFVRYFGRDVLHLPFLSPVPDGIGGLVLNWHIDAKSALLPMARLRALGMFEQGPFSMHITAGPDVDLPGDHKGLDVTNNPVVQDWIRYFKKRGYTIGSHGGWIHNYFGEHIGNQPTPEFEKYLELNEQALQKVADEPIVEYSAPIGNHPQWVTSWLEQHGFLAYYFSGDAGMGPTQVYRDGVKDGKHIWAFPILHMGPYAAFEEMQFNNVPEPIVQRWLLDVTDYVAQEHVVRLVYSHPLGATDYVNALHAWFDLTDKLRQKQDFRWYTMTDMANFLNSREQTQWVLSREEGNVAVLHASNSNGLSRMTWVFPQAQYDDPQVVEGSAEVRSGEGNWTITAKNCRALTVKLNER
jgi:hypothetical protein